ncbi:MAG: hypothetical protein HRT89_09025 [Lentisphaeria bacterium]|nr:hypothetical protein [Lentisphaeria bacterium]NQZ68200.1 hypothetical protein [Lentisphaeria bacterium]
MKKQKFTLIELLVSIALLSIIMLMLLQVFNSLQSAWKIQYSKSKVFENSRIVFDVLEKDIQSIVTCNLVDREIGLRVGGDQTSQGDSTNKFIVCFVSSIDPDDSAVSRLCEISYRFTTDQTYDDRNLLQRQIVSQADATYWDFFTLPENWWNNDASSQPWETVAAGVDSFRIFLFDSTGTPIPSGDSIIQPVQAIVNVTLYDDSLMGMGTESRQNYSKRSFSKVFYLSHIQ